MHHPLELLARDLFLRLGLLVDERVQLHHVARAEEEQAFARQPVAARAPGLLIVTLDVLRQIVVDDEPHVRLVDAHAERDCRANHLHLVAQELLLIQAAVIGLHARVIWRRLHAIFPQPLRHALRALSTLTINDAALVPPRTHILQRLVVRPGLRQHAIVQVRPVEARHVDRWLVQMKLLDDVHAHALRRRRGQRHHRHVREQAAKLRELTILRAEIMPPLAHAMRLVHRDEVHVPALQVREKAREQQPLGRDVEHPELAVVQSPQPGARFVWGQGRV